jgi:hypothetical protein
VKPPDVIRRPWDERDYATLLESFAGHSWLESPRDLTERAGIWLRHDVEVSINAARTMAEMEHDLGVTATYFLCEASPYFKGRKSDLRALWKTLIALGHRVGDHRLAPIRTTPRRLPSWQKRHATHMTYHAPGAPPSALAELDGGDIVYRPIVDGLVTYLSDSTGAFRFGSPADHVDTPGLRLHLLIHPCWWFPSPDVTLETHRSPHARIFLPRVERETTEGAVSVGQQ